MSGLSYLSEWSQRFTTPGPQPRAVREFQSGAAEGFKRCKLVVRQRWPWNGPSSPSPQSNKEAKGAQETQGSHLEEHTTGISTRKF